jgi:hypothetical protein
MALQSINPFSGTELEEFWQQGFALAFLLPKVDHTPPSPLTPEAQDAFAKGATAGELASGQLSVPPTTFNETADWGRLLEIGGHALAERAGFFLELMKASDAGTLTLATVGRTALGGSLSFFMFLVFSGALSGEGDPIEVPAGEALRAVRDKLASAQLADNLDLFMAVCDQPVHKLGVSDAILRNGFWHGTVFLTFDQAVAEGAQHEHLASVRVVHFQTLLPDSVEVLDMPIVDTQ